MAAEQFFLPNSSVLSNGLPQAGAKAYFYLSGTLTPTSVYTTSALTTEHPNPVVADGIGRLADIYLNNTVEYRLIIKDALGAILEEVDPYVPGALGTYAADHVDAVARTATSKLDDWRHVKDFGITGVGDETVLLQQIVTYAASEKKKLVMGPNVTCGAIILPVNSYITPQGSRFNVTSIAGNYTGFSIQGDDVVFEGFNVDDAAKTGGFLFEVAVGSIKLERTIIRHGYSFYSRGGFKDSGTSTGHYVHCELKDVKFRGLKGPGFQIKRALGYFYATQVAVDYVDISDSNYTGVEVDLTALTSLGYAGGHYFTDCPVSGTAGVYNNLLQIGWDLKNASDVKLLRCAADACAGMALQGNTLNKFGAEAFEASNCGGHGMSLTGVTNSSINGPTLYGRRGNATWSPLNADAILFNSGCSDVEVVGGRVRDFTRHGVHQAAAQAGGIDIDGLKAVLNGDSVGPVGRGFKAVGASRIHWNSGTMEGNLAGNYDMDNALHGVFGATLSSGAKSGNLVGPLVG